MDALRQELWDLSGRFEGGISKTKPAKLFLRQLLRQQFDFQKELSPAFLREVALLEAQPPNSRLRAMFRETTGLEVEDYADLSVALYAEVIGGSRRTGLRAFSALRRSYGERVDIFFSLVSRDIYQLVDYFRSIPDAKRKVASEYFEFPLISRYPFYRVGDQLIVWHPAVFYRGMENLVHATMSEHGQAYMAEFTRLFERHVISEAMSFFCKFYNENDLIKFIPRESQVVDGLMAFDFSNIFIEAKAGMFDESVKVAGNADIFSSKVVMLRKAIEQARSVSRGLRAVSSAPENVLEAKLEFLLVVTNKEIGVSRGDRLVEMCQCQLKEDESEGRLPLEHIYFLSIDDFERLISGFDGDHSGLPSMLSRCVERDSSPESSVFYFSQHLDVEGFKRKTSAVVDAALERANQRLARNLGVEPVSL